MRLAAATLLAIVAALPAQAADLGPLEAAEAKVVEAWASLPLMARHALLVTRPAELYGDYVARHDSIYKPGEKVQAYVEPLGFAWKEDPPGEYRFGVSVDFEIRTSGGKVLGGQKDMLHQTLHSHFRNRELYLNLSVNIDAAPDGDYILAYTLRDTQSDKTTSVELPFSIKAQ